MDKQTITQIISEIVRTVEEKQSAVAPKDLFSELQNIPRGDIQEAIKIGLRNGNLKFDDEFKVGTSTKQCEAA